MRLEKYKEILERLIPESVGQAIPCLTLSMVDDYENLYGEIEGIELFLEGILEKAWKLLSKEMSEVNDVEFQELINSSWKENPSTVTQVSRKILEAYYRDERVLNSLGLYAGALNRPLVETQFEDFDGLLSQVIEKGPIYRTL
jgi:hypothetical protein